MNLQHELASGNMESFHYINMLVFRNEITIF